MVIGVVVYVVVNRFRSVVAAHGKSQFPIIAHRCRRRQTVTSGRATARRRDVAIRSSTTCTDDVITACLDNVHVRDRVPVAGVLLLVT